MVTIVRKEAAAQEHTPAVSEDRLLAAMARGETGALEEFYSRTRTAVYAFALSILRHPEDAEDVMQETYIHAFGAAASYRSQGKPMAWLMTIVRNLSLKKLEERGRTVQPEELPEPVDHTDFTRLSADRMLLQAAMELLTPEERQILLLHSTAGLRHRETAALLNIPLATALSKYHRALSKLKKYLEEET